MSILGALSTLAEVGITQGTIDTAIAESVEIKHAVMARAEEVKEYWQSITPVNKTGRPHTLKSGYVDEPGDYKNSIGVRYNQKSTGHFTATVGTQDFKAHWLEYGSIHNPEYGFAQKTVEHFGGTSIQNDNLGPGMTHSVSS